MDLPMEDTKVKGSNHPGDAKFVAPIPHTIHGTGIFTYIWLTFMVNVGKYTIHGWYGI